MLYLFYLFFVWLIPHHRLIWDVCIYVEQIASSRNRRKGRLHICSHSSYVASFPATRRSVSFVCLSLFTASGPISRGSRVASKADPALRVHKDEQESVVQGSRTFELRNLDVLFRFDFVMRHKFHVRTRSHHQKLAERNKILNLILALILLFFSISTIKTFSKHNSNKIYLYIFFFYFVISIGNFQILTCSNFMNYETKNVSSTRD